MNLVPDENEIPFKVVPDKILVNGPGYLFNSELITISIGPSLRYRHLFNSHKLRSKPEYFLIIMPYWDHIVYHIFEVLKGVDWPLPLKIKFHPDTDSDKFKLDFPGMFSVTNQSIPSLLNKTFITIGCSPALIEAASLGIPVIQIQYLDNFNHDYMPEIGKGILWDIANDAKDINNLINMFQLTLNNNPYLFKDEGRKIKSFCFSEPNERLINTAFDLS